MIISLCVKVNPYNLDLRSIHRLDRSKFAFKRSHSDYLFFDYISTSDSISNSNSINTFISISPKGIFNADLQMCKMKIITRFKKSPNWT